MRTTTLGWAVCGVIVLASSLVPGFISAAQAAKPSPGVADCFADLMTGKSTEIVCEFPIDPSAAERDELAKTTRGYLKDVHCLVSIRISRTEIQAAINTPDYVFQSPPQPVACELEANLSKDETRIIPVGGMFAPRVVIKDGIAVEATAGLGHITGVSRPLSWPAETWVNRSATVRNGMLQAVNAWLGFMRAQTAPHTLVRKF